MFAISFGALARDALFIPTAHPLRGRQLFVHLVEEELLLPPPHFLPGFDAPGAGIVSVTLADRELSQRAIPRNPLLHKAKYFVGSEPTRALPLLDEFLELDVDFLTGPFLFRLAPDPLGLFDQFLVVS